MYYSLKNLDSVQSPMTVFPAAPSPIYLSLCLSSVFLVRVHVFFCREIRQRNAEAASAKDAMLKSRHDGFGDEASSSATPPTTTKIHHAAERPKKE